MSKVLAPRRAYYESVAPSTKQAATTTLPGRMGPAEVLLARLLPEDATLRA
jgi:hypothetical protein